MTTAPGIEPDMVATTGVQTTQAQKSAGRFGDVYDWGAYASQVAGPLAYTSTATWGTQKAADIVGASVSAASGGFGMMPGGYSGAYPYYGGGMGMGAGRMAMRSQVQDLNPQSSPDILDMAQQQIAASGAQAVGLILIQDQMGQKTVFNTTYSNMLNQRDNMAVTIVRNAKLL